MQDLFQQLLGNPQRRDELQDFSRRYDQGHPSEGYSGQEVMNRYQQIAPQLPPDVYQQSAAQAFANLTPEERAAFGDFLRQRANQQGITIPDFNQDGIDDRIQNDPNTLARMTTQLHQEQPNLLTQLLGSGGGGANAGAAGLLENPLAKAALAP